MALVIKSNLEDEHSQDYVINAKPGDIVTKKWFVLNAGNIPWPQNTRIICENHSTEI